MLCVVAAQVMTCWSFYCWLGNTRGSHITGLTVHPLICLFALFCTTNGSIQHSKNYIVAIVSNLVTTAEFQ